MANGIWLYYTKKGNLAKIQHGQVIRQGGGFKLIFAFEDESLILDRVLTVAFKKPGGETTPFYPVAEKITKDNIKNYREKFNKIKATEMTYGLQDGVDYYALDFNAPSVGITDKYGVLTVITKVTETVGDIDYIDEDKNGIADNQEKDDIVYFQGSAQLYIEPTYGKPAESSNISMTQYEALLNHMNTELATKIKIDGGIGRSITLEGEIKANTIPSTFIKINAPLNDEDAANKKYVDNSFQGSPTIVDAKLKGTTILNGIFDATSELSSMKVKNPSLENEVANKNYVDTSDKNLQTQITNNDAAISQNRNEIETLKAKKLDAVGGTATDLTILNSMNAVDAIVTVKDIDEDNSSSLQASNKGYVDKRVDNLEISKYVYSENEDKEQLKRNGSIINPKTTATNVATSDGHTVQYELDDIRSIIEDKEHFKGIKSSIVEFDDYENYEPGDYCIVAISGQEDLLYIWDEDKNDWVEKGAYSMTQFTVNNQAMNEVTKNIEVTSQHIKHTSVNGQTTVKDELIKLNEELDNLKDNVGNGYNVINENELFINVDERKAGIYVFPVKSSVRTIRYGTNKNITIEANESAILTLVEGNGYNAFEVMFRNGNVSRGVAYFTGTNSYLYRIVENDKLYSQDKEVALKEDLDKLEGTVNTISSSSLNYRGLWVPGENYSKNDIVTYGKNLYICSNVIENSVYTPDEDTTNWILFVQGFSGNYSDLEGTPTIDVEMSDTSENPVQNKVIKEYIDNNSGTGAADTKIAEHNDDEEAHPYIRQLIEEAKSLLPTITILG